MNGQISQRRKRRDWGEYGFNYNDNNCQISKK